jgi:hypothetical protein
MPSPPEIVPWQLSDFLILDRKFYSSVAEKEGRDPFRASFNFPAEAKPEVKPVEKAPEPKSALAAKVDKAAARKTPAERPESMKSDNPEKDELLMELWEKMRIGQVKDPAVIQAVVAEKEYYDASTPIRDYDIDFIEGCLIEAWDKVLGLALTKQNDLPF